MKKRGLVVVLVLCLSLSLSLIACGKKIPNGISEEAYNYGLKVVETTESFLNADISVDEARVKVNTLSDLLSSLDSEEFNEQMLSTKVATLSLSFINAAIQESIHGKVPSDNLKDIREQLNSIKDDLGLE